MVIALLILLLVAHVVGLGFMVTILKHVDTLASQRRTGTTVAESVDRLERLSHSVLAAVTRQEASALTIAENLGLAKIKVEGVATDLAESQHRADRVVEGAPGEAADAGAQSSSSPNQGE